MVNQSYSNLPNVFNPKWAVCFLGTPSVDSVHYLENESSVNIIYIDKINIEVITILNVIFQETAD